MKKGSRARLIINVVTFILVVVLLYFAWPEISCLWDPNLDIEHCGTDKPLLFSVNIWILLLLIPLQIFSYFANGMTIFSYLRARGQLHKLKRNSVASISLELNFVNHIIPSGGVSGITYMVWRLRQLGISSGQATMAQLVRMASIAVAFIALLAIALIWVTIENVADSWIVMLSAVSVTAIIFIIIFSAYLIGSKHRMISFAKWISRVGNKLVRGVTFGRVSRKVIPEERLQKVFLDIYDDFVVLKAQKKLLIKPLLWGFVFLLADVGLFAVAFWALGTPFNFAMLVIGYGAASVIGAVVFTPGGAGGFEATMIAVLVSGGMMMYEALAGVVLARVILIVGTLATGYVVYHRAMQNFGKPIMETQSVSPHSTRNDTKEKAK